VEVSPSRKLAAPEQPRTAAPPEASGRRWPRWAGVGQGRWSLATVTWVGSFLTLSVVLVVRNAYLFTTKIYEDQDFAANTIAVLQAKHFDLLTGNYSKEGFYHPGPAFLYVMAAGESFFHDLLHLVPTPWNGQLIAILLLNAALIGASLAVVARQAASGRVALAALAVALLFAALHPLTVNSAWMPYVYFAPTLLLLVSAASVATGQTVDLWLLALSAWLCINGQAEFLLFSPVIVVASLASMVIVRRRRRAAGDTVPRVPARHWIGAAAVSAVLAFPIALNTALHWPGQFGKYIHYGAAASGHLTHHSVLFSIGYMLRYWWPGVPHTTADGGGLLVGVAVCLLALALAWYCPARGLRRFLLASLAAAGLMTVLFVYYALKGVDDRDIAQAYLGYFYWAAPLLVVIVGVAAVAVRVNVKRAAVLGLVAAVAGAAVIATVVPQHRDNRDDPPAKYYGDPKIPHAVEELAAAADGRPIVLNILNHDWIDTVGLVAYADRIGVRSCVIGAGWTILFRAQSICTASEAHSGVKFWLGAVHRHPRPGWRVAATLPNALITQQP
jgi:hypothetical protein